VILDTNFLTIPAQFGVDVFSETEKLLKKRVEFVILDSVMAEIKLNFERAGRAESRLFKVALDLTERCRVVEVDPQFRECEVDDQLLEYAVAVNGVLATNDRELRNKAIERGVPVLLLRSRKHLELRGTIF
jgi:rRNA-processing protein FCF1